MADAGPQLADSMCQRCGQCAYVCSAKARKLVKIPEDQIIATPASLGLALHPKKTADAPGARRGVRLVERVGAVSLRQRPRRGVHDGAVRPGGECAGARHVGAPPSGRRVAPRGAGRAEQPRRTRGLFGGVCGGMVEPPGHAARFAVRAEPGYNRHWTEARRGTCGRRRYSLRDR